VSGSPNNDSLCTTFVAKPRPPSQTIALRNQPAVNASIVDQVTDGTRLQAVLTTGDQQGQGGEWMRVSFRNSAGLEYGRVDLNQDPLFVARADVACDTLSGMAPPRSEQGTTTTLGTGSSAPQSQGQAPQVVTPVPVPVPTGPTQGGTPAVPPPPAVETAQCKVITPLFSFWAGPECTKSDGTKIKLDKDSVVTIKTQPEPGAPTRFFEIKQRCTIPSDRINKESCDRPFKN
jgi:hypothetical protein